MVSEPTTKIDVYRNDIALSTATGFIMRYGQSYVLVTNWHVLSGFNPANGKCLSDTGAIPNRIEFHVSVSRRYVTAEKKLAEMLPFKPLAIDLWIDEQPVWLDDRSDDLQNDYAAIHLERYLPELKEKGCSLRAILGGRVTPKKDAVFTKGGPFRADDFCSIYPPVGTEVFVLGYPRGIATNGLFPIWKRGSIGSEPQGSITLAGREYENAFYIDALTKSGMSGSPVVSLCKPGDRLYSEEGVTCEVKLEETYVVGVYAGRDGVTQEEYELSLGRVWKIGAVEKLLLESIRSQAGESINGENDLETFQHSRPPAPSWRHKLVRVVVASKNYIVRRVATLLKFGRTTKDPAVSAAPIDKAAPEIEPPQR
jgi:hypothetical protein